MTQGFATIFRNYDSARLIYSKLKLKCSVLVFICDLKDGYSILLKELYSIADPMFNLQVIFGSISDLHHLDKYTFLELVDQEIVYRSVRYDPMPPIQTEEFENSVMGGTFDYLHNGHRLLLSMAALLTRTRLLIGISDNELLKAKTLKNLIQPFEVRVRNVVDFLRRFKPSLSVVCVPINDPFGPSITDDNLQAVIVSKETEAGGHAINVKRKEMGLNELKVRIVELIMSDGQKQSSTMIRTLKSKEIGS